MNTRNSSVPRASGSAITGELFSPSDRKVIRMDDWRRDRLNQRHMPTLSMPGWIIGPASNDPTPPRGGAPAAKVA